MKICIKATITFNMADTYIYTQSFAAVVVKYTEN